MTKKAYIVKQRIEHDGIDYNPWAYPFEEKVIFAEPHEVDGALKNGALEEDPTIPIPPEEKALPQKENSIATKTLTPMLKPIV